MTERQPPPSPQRLRYKFISPHTRSASWPGLAPINAFAWLFSHAANYERSHDHFPFMRPPFKRPPAPTPSVTIHLIYHRCGLAFCVLYTPGSHSPARLDNPSTRHNPIPHTSMTISAASKLTNAHAVRDWSGVHLAFRHCYADASNDHSGVFLPPTGYSPDTCRLCIVINLMPTPIKHRRSTYTVIWQHKVRVISG